MVINYTSSSSTALAQFLAARLESTYGVRAVLAQADLSAPDGPASLVSQTAAAFSPADPAALQVDVLVNNAGIALNNPLPALQASEFTRTYAVNVLAPLLLVQALLPHLPHDRSGRIVNISSVSSTTGFVGQSVYGGTKAAIEAMTRTWARELSENCTVNAVNPGPVEGPMYAANTDEFKEGIKGWIMHSPLMRARPGVDAPDVIAEANATAAGGRPAYTHEVAGVVGMLCTADAAWVTGQVVCANGGMLMLH